LKVLLKPHMTQEVPVVVCRAIECNILWKPIGRAEIKVQGQLLHIVKINYRDVMCGIWRCRGSYKLRFHSYTFIVINWYWGLLNFAAVVRKSVAVLIVLLLSRPRLPYKSWLHWLRCVGFSLLHPGRLTNARLTDQPTKGRTKGRVLHGVHDDVGSHFSHSCVLTHHCAQ
jgi:hypothetical protein